ncbi:MAG: hypothetical protein LC687_02390 [Actinobacteria bacterium]|nr:hypothetical protein [Actinomycetota bacterium]
MITKTLNAVDGDDAALTGVTYYDDDTDQKLDNPVEREKGSELEVRAEKDGYNSKVQTVTFVTDGEVTFTLTKDNPDEVTKPYSIRDEAGELISEADLFSADTLASAGPEGTVTLPTSQEAVEVCGRAEWYEEICQTVETSNDQPITLTLPAETVEITVTPEIVGHTDILRRDNANSWPGVAIDHTIYVLQIGDSTWKDDLESHDDDLVDYLNNPYIAEGTTTTVTVPARSDPHEISLRAVYVPKEGNGFNDSHWLNVAEGSITAAGDSDSNITLNLEHIPACRDGVDNTFDGRMDENAPGCLDTEASTSIEPGTDGFVYEPDDDNEQLRAHTRTHFFYASQDYGVSGAEGERESDFITLYQQLPEAFQIAIDVETRFTKLVSAEQGGEEFAMEYYTGRSADNLNTVNTTDIVPDEGHDGWTEVAISLSREYYAKGTYHGVKFIHATEVRDEPFTDGEDDVVIFEKERDDGIAFIAFYEEEELSTEAALMPAKTDGDVKVTDTVVGDVEITDTPVKLK